MQHPFVLASMFILLLGAPPLSAGSADLAFEEAGEGWLAFDTGVVRGKLQADGKSQGMPTFVDVKTGTELAYGGRNPGILSFYRLLSAGKRWVENRGHTFRQWPQTVKVLADGSAQVRWPSQEEHPVEVTATFRWISPTTIDCLVEAKPDIAMQDFEVFLSSYFNGNFESRVYVQSPLHARGNPYFLDPVGGPLVLGTYLTFPKDLRAAQMTYDGRWEQGQNPVQWSVSLFMAEPLALMRDSKSDITFVQMCRPEDCFAVRMPYNLTPPDGVAGHHSIYLSLFGGNVRAGQTVRALVRMIVDRGITDEKALEAYRSFVKAPPER